MKWNSILCDVKCDSQVDVKCGYENWMYDIILIIEDDNSLCNFCNLYALNAYLNVDFHRAPKIKNYYIVLDFNGVVLSTCPNTTNNANKYANPLITFKVGVREFLLLLLHNFTVILWTCSRRENFFSCTIHVNTLPL